MGSRGEQSQVESASLESSGIPKSGVLHSRGLISASKFLQVWKRPTSSLIPHFPEAPVLRYKGIDGP